MGVLRALQPEPSKPGYRERRVGQARQGEFFFAPSKAADAAQRKSHRMQCNLKYLLLQSLRAMRQPITKCTDDNEPRSPPLLLDHQQKIPSPNEANRAFP